MLRPIPFDMLFLTKDLKRTCYEISSLAGNTRLGKNTLAESYISFSACFIFQTYSPNFFKLFSFFFLDSTNVSFDAWKMEDAHSGQKHIRSRLCLGKGHKLSPFHSCFPVHSSDNLRSSTSNWGYRKRSQGREMQKVQSMVPVRRAVQ